MFRFQDGIIDESDGEKVEEFFQYFIVKGDKIMLKHIRNTSTYLMSKYYPP